MVSASCVAKVVFLYLHVLSAAQTEDDDDEDDANVQISPSGTFLKKQIGRLVRHRSGGFEPSGTGDYYHGFRRAVTNRSGEDERAAFPFFSPLQLASEGFARPANTLPWPYTPLCQFEAEGSFTSLVRVFVDVDNTRAFVFDSDAKGAQTKVQCHGATPDSCTKPRLLAPGVPESCENHKCPCIQATLSQETIRLTYVKKMVQKVGPYCAGDGGAKILHIGLGGGAVSKYLLDNCATGTHVTSVEKDPRIIKMADKFFGLQVEPGRNDVENLDAGVAVQRHVEAGDAYDVVLIDCVEAQGHVPDSCNNKEFIRGVRNILKPSGMAIQHGHSDSQLSSLAALYNAVFDPLDGDQSSYSADPGEGDMNFLMIARAGS